VSYVEDLDKANRTIDDLRRRLSTAERYNENIHQQDVILVGMINQIKGQVRDFMVDGNAVDRMHHIKEILDRWPKVGAE